MVNVRNPAGSSKGKGKGLAEPGSSVRPSTGHGVGWRVLTSSPAHHHTREGSPGKNVHFGRNLIQGPSWFDSARRSQSPTRPAIHKRDPSSDSPGAQLQAEQDAAQVGRPGSKRKRGIFDVDWLSTEREGDDTHGRGTNGATSHGRQQRTSSLESLVHNQNKRSRNASGNQSIVDETSDEEPTRYDSVLGIKQSGPAPKSTQSRPPRLVELKDDEVLIMRFAESFAAVTAHQKASALDSLLRLENAHLVKHLSCLAMGGKSGIDGWCELLADTTCRHALVVGIISRSLKEHVFSALYFGGSGALVEELSKKEQEQAHQDGFFRTRERADAISKHKPKSTDAANLRKAITRVTLQLERMLLPLWIQGANTNLATWRSCRKRHELAQIVSTAADLSRTMRASPDVVYYWPPTFKDEEFEPTRMECFNLKTMINESPYDKKAVSGFDRAVLREGHEHESEAIVRVVCFPGLVAYRQHGGDLAQRELAEEAERQGRERLPPDVQMQRKRLAMHENTLTGDEGFRTRLLCKSVVLLQWGKQRLLTKEAGTSRHIDAMKGKGVGMKKYEDDYDGFVELYDLFETVIREGKTLSQLQKEMSASRTPSLVSSVTRLFSRSPSATSIAVVDREPGGWQFSTGSRPGSRGQG